MIPTGEPVDLAPPEADREENALRMKKNLILLFLLLAGVMFVSLLAAATRGIPWLSWLSYGQTVGISVDNPMILDLAVIQLAFGFELGVNIAQIICVLIAIFAYKGWLDSWVFRLSAGNPRGLFFQTPVCQGRSIQISIL